MRAGYYSGDTVSSCQILDLNGYMLGYFEVPSPPISRIRAVSTRLVDAMRSNHRILKTTITCCRTRVDSTSGSIILGENGQISGKNQTSIHKHEPASFQLDDREIL